MRKSYEIGQEAENAAAKWFLAQRNAKLLAQNFRCRGGEIDLIFEESCSQSQEKEIVFLEVKARSIHSWTEGVESMTWQKRQRLQKTARYFLFKYRGKATRIRFDFLQKKGDEWELFQNIQMNER